MIFHLIRRINQFIITVSVNYMLNTIRKSIYAIAYYGKGTYINDVRQFLTIFDPPSPLTSDFYLLMSDFFGSFQTPPPPLKSDIIYARSQRIKQVARLSNSHRATFIYIFNFFQSLFLIRQATVILKNFRYFRKHTNSTEKSFLQTFLKKQYSYKKLDLD